MPTPILLLPMPNLPMHTQGLMVKAASRPYVPNARTNVLKLKAEFIPGLGDSVTVLVVGARCARRVGSGSGATYVCELACAALSGAGAPSGAGGAWASSWTWLFNTAALASGEKGRGLKQGEQE